MKSVKVLQSEPGQTMISPERIGPDRNPKFCALITYASKQRLPLSPRTLCRAWMHPPFTCMWPCEAPYACGVKKIQDVGIKDPLWRGSSPSGTRLLPLILSNVRFGVCVSCCVDSCYAHHTTFATLSYWRQCTRSASARKTRGRGAECSARHAYQKTLSSIAQI